MLRKTLVGIFALLLENNAWESHSYQLRQHPTKTLGRPMVAPELVNFGLQLDAVVPASETHF